MLNVATFSKTTVSEVSDWETTTWKWQVHRASKCESCWSNAIWLVTIEHGQSQSYKNNPSCDTISFAKVISTSERFTECLKDLQNRTLDGPRLTSVDPVIMGAHRQDHQKMQKYGESDEIGLTP